MREKSLVKEEALTRESLNLKWQQEKWKLREIELKLESERYRRLQEKVKIPSHSLGM